MRIRLPLTTLAALSLAACSQPATKPEPPAVPVAVSAAQLAEVNLSSTSASLVSGRVAVVPQADGVHITGVIGGLPRDKQAAFHVHEKGDCSAVDASSAGGHFNPAAQTHGRAGSSAHHAGDMDNLQANGEGVANVDVYLHGVTLGGGATNDIAGRALVVHAAADDYHSQPAGNAGARVACGVIRVIR